MQVAALARRRHDRQRGDRRADWSPPLTATTTSLLNRTTVSATTLRPFRTATVRSSSASRPTGLGASASWILNSARFPVRIVALGAASSWNCVDRAELAQPARTCPTARYYLQAYLPDATGALVAVANPRRRWSSRRQAAAYGDDVVDPALPGARRLQDTITVASSALVPSVMTLEDHRSGKTCWQTTLPSRHGTAKAIYGGAIGSGVPPAGTYGLYVYARAARARRSSARRCSPSTQKAVKSAFRVTSQRVRRGPGDVRRASGNELHRRRPVGIPLTTRP